MSLTALFIITSDPRVSARPAEAVRIVAGVGAWKKVDLTVYLRGTAVLALSEYTDGLVDEENFTSYWPLVAALGRPIYVERGSSLLTQIGQTIMRIEEINDSQLSRLAAERNYVVYF